MTLRARWFRSKQRDRGKGKELDNMKKIPVWRVVSRALTLAKKKPGEDTWNAMGDRELCAQEFAGKSKREDLFAGAPPLTAVRYVLSSAVSRGRASVRQKIALVDTEKAFLHGVMRRELYVELPPEDEDSQGGRNIGRGILLKSGSMSSKNLCRGSGSLRARLPEDGREILD